MFVSKFIAVFLLAATTTDAIAPVAVMPRAFQTAAPAQKPLPSTASPLMEESSLITPEGYGFSTPVIRILKESERGYHKAEASDTVIDVMQAITAGDYDVALVYDDQELVGLFTETDYIRVSDTKGSTEGWVFSIVGSFFLTSRNGSSRLHHTLSVFDTAIGQSHDGKRVGGIFAHRRERVRDTGGGTVDAQPRTNGQRSHCDHET